MNLRCPKCGKDLGVPKSAVNPGEKEWCLTCKPLPEEPSGANTQTWTVVSVPGREEDGSDTVWFAWNPLTRDCVTGPSRREAAEIMRQRNSRQS